MEINEIKKLIESSYDIKILSIEKVKNVYKIGDAVNYYCLKVIKYEFPHFLFIISAIRYLQNRGFEYIPKLLATKEGMEYIKFCNCYAYLTPWIEARECNYDNPMDIITAAKKLAELHLRSQGFELTKEMRPRIGWFKWIETFRTRRDEILDFKRRINDRVSKTEFDNIYMKLMDKELERCEKSIANLIKSEYANKMAFEIKDRGFCHHDFAHHNVLIGKTGEVFLIDFDYAILDTHLHDLSSFLIRRMKNGKWDINHALQLINAYDSIYKVDASDIPVMAAFMEFPQDYWQVGIQYYWEKQPWGEEFFLKKLRRILEDSDEKQEFIDEFRLFRYE